LLQKENTSFPNATFGIFHIVDIFNLHSCNTLQFYDKKNVAYVIIFYNVRLGVVA